jgi:hypothetical protein
MLNLALGRVMKKGIKYLAEIVGIHTNRIIDSNNDFFIVIGFSFTCKFWSSK